jgi:hypothetical protein
MRAQRCVEMEFRTGEGLPPRAYETIVSTKPIAPTPLRTPLPPRPAVSPSEAPTVSQSVPALAAPVVPKAPRMPSLAPSRDGYVYQPDGRHIGPLSTTSLARAWLENQLPRDAYIGASGSKEWWPLGPALEILEAARVIESSPRA